MGLVKGNRGIAKALEENLVGAFWPIRGYGDPARLSVRSLRPLPLTRPVCTPDGRDKKTSHIYI